jgi:AcrR family transcriptional regulator
MKRRWKSHEELELAVVQRACSELRKLTGREHRPLDPPDRPLPDPVEVEVREAIDDLRAAVDALASVVARAKAGTCDRRLARWASVYGSGIVDSIRAMRVPWEPLPQEPETLVARLVQRAFVEGRDLLSIGRLPTDRELACLAIVRGYYPNLGGSGLDKLDVPAVLKRATNAVREARKRTIG